jgi:hypothetical protein
MSTIGIIIFFIVTASFGLVLLTFVMRNKRRPIYLVAIHGLLAVASYGMLTYNVGLKAREEQLANVNYPLEHYAYVFFSFAAVGGLFMLIRDKVLNKGIPKWLPFVHGGLAAIGLIFLIIGTLMHK